MDVFIAAVTCPPGVVRSQKLLIQEEKMKTSIKLTVFFEGMFWVGIFERIYEGKYEASRVVFGAEPKDYDVYAFILKNYTKLKFSSSILQEESPERKINPKRLQREIKKETENKEIGTKAQLAMKLQHEENKTERTKKTKMMKEEEQKERFELRQSKKKEKHKGH